MNNILILEDNIDLSKQIKTSLTQIPEVNHIQTATTIREAIGFLDVHKYSLFVVDLELPDGIGYDFIKYIRTKKEYETVHVVIVTGRNEGIEDILDAYNTKACQMYFRKPFEMQKLHDEIKNLLNFRTVKTKENRLMIKRKRVNIFFELNDIIYIETNNKITTIFTTTGESNIGRYSLNKLMEELPDNEFVRCHRAFLVNMKYVKSLVKSSNTYYIQVQKYGINIPVGVSYKHVVELLNA